MNAPPRLILASGSTRRRELLKQIGLEPDKIAATDIDETPLNDEKPAAFARRLAVGKLAAVRSDAPDSYVLAADTVVGVGRRILSKPADELDARRFLQLMSGRRQSGYGRVYTMAPA